MFERVSEHCLFFFKNHHKVSFMRSAFQVEFFGAEQYTRLCSICRGEFPRSSEFFPEGRCKDLMASFCRKCANVRTQTNRSSKENSIISFLGKSCKECGEIKQLREFYMSSQFHDGKTSACKKCIDEKHEESEIRQRRLAGFEWAVYFIQDSRNKRVKIGSSDDLELTISTLQEGSSETLHILAYHDTAGEDAAEMIVNTLHCMFQNYHTGNGWFEMVPSIEQYIILIQHGDFEKAELLLNPIENTEKNPHQILLKKKV